MIELPSFPSHSDRIWDYLGDMADMPSPNDRDSVCRKAAGNSSQAHRVQIWDYFFRPKPEDVGKPIRRELDELRAEVATREAGSHRRLQQGLHVLAQLEKTREDENAGVERELIGLESKETARETANARRRIYVGITLGGASLLTGLLLYLSNDQVAGHDGLEGQLEALGVGCLSVIWLLLAVPVIAIAVWLAYTGNRRLAADRIRGVVLSAQQHVRERWAQRDFALTRELEMAKARVEGEQEILALLVPHLRSRIASLEQSLQNLLKQVPPVATADQVESWLAADLQQCIDEGEEQLGVVGRTIEVLGTKKPFQILGPAEIQDPASIPPAYSRGNNSDRKKHLHARRFEMTSDGRLAQHYGVFHLELLFITDAILARYSVFFDFILGDIIAERAPQQHFVDVVLLEMRREYRQISVNGEVVDLDRAPSMILALSNGDRVSITLTSAEYFHKVGASEVARENEPATAVAENALKAITERVNVAKRNMEVGQIAHLKEAEIDRNG